MPDELDPQSEELLFKLELGPSHMGKESRY